MAIEFEETDFEVSDWKITYGYCSALEYDIEGETATVHSINASPGGCGIGRASCQKFEKMAIDTGCNFAIVPASLTAEALGFWVAMGYDVEDKRDRRKMKRIIERGCESRDDGQGVIVLEKRFI